MRLLLCISLLAIGCTGLDPPKKPHDAVVKALGEDPLRRLLASCAPTARGPGLGPGGGVRAAEESGRLHAKAKERFDAGDYVGAIPLFQEAVTASKFSYASASRELLAISLMKVGRLEEAVCEIEAALKQPGTPWKETAGNVWISLANDRYEKGRYDDAVAFTRRAFELHPGFPAWLHCRKGYLEMYKGRIADADVALRTCLSGSKSAPLNATAAHLGLAWIHRERAQIEEARGEIRAALELSPRLAQRYSDGRELDVLASEKREAGLSASVDRAKALESRGQILEAFMAWKEARSWFTLANSMTWFRGPLRTEREQALDFEVETALARLYPRLPSKPPDDEAVRRFRVQAEAAIREKRVDDAWSAYQMLLEYDPTAPDAWFNIALLNESSSAFAAAIANMKRYLLLVPNAPNARLAQDKIYEWEAKTR